MARLENAIRDIMEVFKVYAEDGKICKTKFQEMMTQEFQTPEIKEKFCSLDFDKVMGRVDKNKDGVDFEEFMECVKKIAIKCCKCKGCDK